MANKFNFIQLLYFCIILSLTLCNPDLNCVAYDSYQRKCTVCISGFEVENGKCVQAKCSISFCKFCADDTTCQQCVDYYHLNDDNTECRPSVFLCEEHNNDNTCKECEQTFTQNSDNTQCENGYSGACTFDHCVRCTHSSQCGQCEAGYLVRGQECVKEIESCSEQEYKLCRKCKTGLYPQTLEDNNGEQYSICQTEKCANVNIPDCLEMNNDCKCNICSSVLQLDLGTCVKQCPSEGYYFTEERYTIQGETTYRVKHFCGNCIENCKECWDDKTCQKCNTGYEALGGLCYEDQCQYNNPNINCAVYDTFQRKCTICLSGFEVKNGECVQSKCSISFCNFCVDDTTCQQCVDYYHLNDDKTECRPSVFLCEEHNNDNTCKECEQTFTQNSDNTQCENGYSGACTFDHCVRCTHSSQCGQCEAGYLVRGQECVKEIENCSEQEYNFCRKCENNLYPLTISEQYSVCQSDKCANTRHPYCLVMNTNCECEACQDFLTDDRECITQCQGSFYILSQTITINYKQYSQKFCSKCIDHCLQCDNGSTCQECESNYQLVNKKCELIPNCKALQKYEITENNIIKCVDNCLQGTKLNTQTNKCEEETCSVANCSDYGSNCECKVCDSTYYRLKDSQGLISCVKKCPENYFNNEEQLSINGQNKIALFCDGCPIGCECNSDFTCLKCINNSYQFVNQKCQLIPNCKALQQYEITENNIIKCVDNCPQGTKLNTQTNKCEEEICSVANCSDYGSNCECKVCDSTYYRLKDSQGLISCVKKCPENYFDNEEELSINGQNKIALFCDGCPIGCECNSDFTCLKCINNSYQVVNQKCELIPDCKSQQKIQIIENEIIKCVSSCPDGTSYIEKSNSCDTCQDTTCLSFGDNCVCQICKPSKYLITFQEKVQCFDSCTDGYFDQEENVSLNSQTVIKQYCTKCIDFCIECNNINTCKICDNNYALIDGICLHKNDVKVECSSNQFKLIQNNREICVSECPKLYFSYKYICYSQCPVSTVSNLNHECEECHSSCNTCSAPADSQKCISCPSGKVLSKVYSTVDIEKEIEENEEKENIILFMAALKLNKKMDEILGELRYANLDYIDIILELANNYDFLLITSNFQNQAEFSSLINKNYELINGLTIGNFPSFVSKNSKALSNLETILENNSKASCISNCLTHYFNQNGVCNICSRLCKECTNFGEYFCTSCWDSYILNSQLQTCQSKYIVSSEIAQLGEDEIKNEINKIDSSTELLSLTQKYQSLYYSISDNSKNSFQAQQLVNDEENSEESQEKLSECQNIKGTVRSALIHQVQEISQISPQQSKQNVTEILEIANSIANIDIEESSESDLKQLASIFNSNQFTDQIIDNSNIEKGFNFVDKLIKVKVDKELLLNKAQSNTSNSKLIKLSSEVSEEIKNGFNTLVKGFLKNDETLPIKLENDNFALSLQKIALNELDQAFTQLNGNENEENISSVGFLKISDGAIDSLKKQFEKLENTNIVISQTLFTNEDFTISVEDNAKKYSNIIDFSFQLLNKNNETENIKIENSALEITIPKIDETTMQSSDLQQLQYACKFFNRTTNKWSSEGVKLKSNNAESFVCSTTHLTEYIITNYQEETLENDKDNDSNNNLLIILLSLSILIITCLIIALLFWKFKIKKTSQAKVQAIKQESEIETISDSA